MSKFKNVEIQKCFYLNNLKMLLPEIESSEVESPADSFGIEWWMRQNTTRHVKSRHLSLVPEIVLVRRTQETWREMQLEDDVLFSRAK